MYKALAMFAAAAGVLVLGISLMSSARWRPGVSVALDLWMAAGLLRLTADPSWASIGVAAVVLLVRQVIVARTKLRFDA